MKPLLRLVTFPSVVAALTMPLAAKAAELPRFSKIIAIRIGEQYKSGIASEWTSSHYNLVRGKSGFSGQAAFSAGAGSEGKTSHKTVSVSVPMAKARVFFQMLAKTHAVERAYRPAYPDGYSSIKITFVAAGGDASVFSQSQGANNVPWALTFKGKTYVIDSDGPAWAMNVLIPYLKRDIRARLFNENMFPRSRYHDTY